MSKSGKKDAVAKQDALFDRVIDILEQARGNVVRAVNTNMVLAYWLIGREIVQEVQGGEERAEYGKQVLESLSARLNDRYGKGFSIPNLQNFRKFYLAYSQRFMIPRPAGVESGNTRNLSPAEHGLAVMPIQYPTGTNFAVEESIQYPMGTELAAGFSPMLSWSHYRALMRVENAEARDFYEREAIAGGWDKRTLERQIQSFYYERILKSRKPQKMLAEGRSLPVFASPAADELKNPYVLEFLGLPDSAEFHETDLEQAIITHLQRFLLELGRGFAFVARQKHIHIEEQDRFIDLVFYHCRL